MGGTFLDADSVEVEKVTFSRSWLRKFTQSPPQLLVSSQGMGDSMMPTIHDRDIVIIDRSNTRLDGEMGDKIWAIVFAGMGMIKRLRQMPDGTVKIMSDNQLVRDEIATDGDLHIVGRVVAKVSSL
jgi:phage repressor protein C with HTH and peptisase S24 domain